MTKVHLHYEIIYLFRPPLQEKKEKEKDVVESPMSVVDTSILSMSISQNESQIIDDDDDDTTTAQSDREMFFHVVEYRQDIYDYMREIEVSLEIILCIFNTNKIYFLTRFHFASLAIVFFSDCNKILIVL